MGVKLKTETPVEDTAKLEAEGGATPTTPDASDVTPGQPAKLAASEQAPAQSANDADIQLGEGGQKALRAERAGRKAAETLLKAQEKTFEERLAALETENARLRAEQFQAQVESLASHMFEHPSAAMKLADVREGMSEREIQSALDQVLKEMPELAKRAEKPAFDPDRFRGVIPDKAQTQHEINAMSFANLVDSTLNSR